MNITLNEAVNRESLDHKLHYYMLNGACGEQGCRNGESTRLPPMWPGFDSPFSPKCFPPFLPPFSICLVSVCISKRFSESIGIQGRNCHKISNNKSIFVVKGP